MHAAKAAASSLHWNVPCSFAVNAKFAAWLVVGSVGFCAIVTIGPVASIVQLYATFAPTLPAASVGRTVQNYTVYITTACMLIVTFGLILMATERAERARAALFDRWQSEVPPLR